MVKVEAVVIRERIETVIDAVEDATGHVGVTVVEAVGHGRQRGITHEYRGRVFESRFLPKALLTFLVRDEIAMQVAAAIADAARSGHESGDGLVWQSAGRERRPQPDREAARGGGERVSNKDLLIAASTIWVVITAVLVMFMQAGFAFLEAGLTRMKNAGHIAGKNVLIFASARSSTTSSASASRSATANGVHRRLRLLAVGRTSSISVGQTPFDWFSEIPGAAGYLFEVVFAGVSLAIVWGAMAERAKLYVYFVFGDLLHADLLDHVSHWIWSPHGWLFAQGHAGLRRLDRRALPGRARRRSPARCCSGRASASSAPTAGRTRSPGTTSRTPCSGRSSSGSAGSASTRARRCRSTSAASASSRTSR